MSAPPLAESIRHLPIEAVAPAQWPLHLPPVVIDALHVLAVDCVVFAVDPEDSDTARFSARYGFVLADCANTIVLRSRREGELQHDAVVTLGSNRLDVNGAVRQRLGAQRISFASRDVATAITGMEFGGITAIGLPAAMRVLVDEAVFERPYVVLGAGWRRSKLLIRPEALRRIPRVEAASIALRVD